MKNQNLNIFFIDEHNSSKQNGIGTYRDLLLPRLAQEPDVNVTLISLNSDHQRMVEEKTEVGREISLPFFNNGNWRGSGEIICPMLKGCIQDSPSNVFMMNHSPAADFIKELKECFPKSKIMSTVHDQGWCGTLMGSEKNLHTILVDGECPEGLSQEICDDVRRYCGTEQAIYSLVDKVISISPFMDTVLADIYKVPAEKRAMIFNGYKSFGRLSMSQSEARAKLGFSDDEELVIFAGRPAVHKGIIPMVKAVSKLRKGSHPRLRLILCGSMHGFADYAGLIKRNTSGLVFAGQISRHELPLWHRASDVGIMPSYSEPFGYSAIEMADMGLPLVVSDGTALRDIYHDGENAFVASIGPNVNDTEYFTDNLADALHKALTATPTRKKNMVAANRRLIRTDFSVDTMVRGYLDVMQALTA